MSEPTRVCASADLEPNQALKIVVEGVPIALVKDSAGVIHALGDTCTHGDISLSEGFVEDDALECWAHGSRFSLKTGIPMNLPAYEPVPVYVVTLIDDGVYLDPSVTLSASDIAAG